jgi:dTMP kinase
LTAVDQRADRDGVEPLGGQAQQAGLLRGKFITFEGGEGSGKSTQATMLAKRLEALGIAVLLTREPGGSPGAEIIRHVLLSGAAKPLGPEAEAILFAAARDDHVRCTIAPALAAGKWVICDRFADSTRVYQGALGEVDPRLLKALERASIGDLKPDLTFVLDVPVEVGLERAAVRRNGSRADRFEAEEVKAHEKLRDAYLALAAAEPNRCVLVDASVDRDAIAKRIWAVVDLRFTPALAPLTAETLVP